MRNLTSTLALVVGVVFIAAGILGFFDNPLIGKNGYFYTDMLNNVLYLITGVVALGFGLADAEPAVGNALKVIGGIYLLFAVVGFIGLAGADNTFMGINTASNWLHLILGAGALAAGLATHSATSMRTHHAR